MKKFLSIILAAVMMLGIMGGAMTVFAEEDKVEVVFSDYEFTLGQIPVLYVSAYKGSSILTGVTFTIKDSEGEIVAEPAEAPEFYFARTALPAYNTPGKKDFTVTVTKGDDTLVEDFPVSIFVKYGISSDNIYVFDNATKTKPATKTTVNINTYAGIVGFTIPVAGVTAERTEQKTTRYDGQSYSVEKVTIYVPDGSDAVSVDVVAPAGTIIQSGKFTYSLSNSGQAVLANYPLNSSIDLIVPATDKTVGLLLQVSIESTHKWDGYTFDDEYHWHECEECGEILDKEAHDLNAKGACKVCKYKKGAEEFTLTFETNGGTPVTALTREKGKKLNIVNAIPERLGYTFSGWYYDKEFTQKAEVVELNENTTVYAKWVSSSNPFTDIKSGDEYYDDIMFVYNRDLMIGLTNTAFGPDATITRGMIVTILYRLEGEPAFMNDNMFTDVQEGSYYEKAVVWANGKGIVNGYPGNKFAPEKAISRQELLTIVYRYCQFKGYNTEAKPDTNTLDYDDIMDIAEYAGPAVHWSIHQIFEPKDLKILPKADATRAFTAYIFHNLCTEIVK